MPTTGNHHQIKMRLVISQCLSVRAHMGLIEKIQTYDTLNEAKDSLKEIKGLDGFLFGYLLRPKPGRKYDILFVFDFPEDKIMPIIDLNQKEHENKIVTVEGVVRAAYLEPFPHVLIQDHSATLICRPSGRLPWPGEHLEITGRFMLETPQNSTVELPILKAMVSVGVAHRTATCNHFLTGRKRPRHKHKRRNFTVQSSAGFG